VEQRFCPLPEIHGHHRLGNSVCDRRHAEQTDASAVRFRYLDTLDRGRKVGPRAHPIPDPIEIVLQIRLELAQSLLVHSRGTLVGRNPPVRLPHHLLGNVERLDLRRWHVSSLPPGRARLIDSTFLMSRPLGSTPTSRQQGLHSYCGPVRRRTSHRYSVPSVSASAGSLLGPGGSTSPSERSTVSTFAFSRSVQERQSRLTPPLRRMPPGQSAGVRQACPRGIWRTPGFDIV
jgi:hypothetical protein